AHRDVRLLAAGQGDAAPQDGVRVAFDAVQEAAVDAGHGGHAGPAAPVEQGQQAVALGEQGAGPAHLEVHQTGEVGALGRGRRGEPGRAAELGEVVGGQVGAAADGVLADVAQDVGELEGEA